MVISMNVLRVQRSRSCAIYSSLCLSKVLPTALSIPAVSIDEYPSSSVESDPHTACIEKAAIQQHTSKIFWWHQYFKSSRNLRSVEGSQWALTSSFDSRVYAKNVGSFKLEVSLKLPIWEKKTCMRKLRNCTFWKLGWPMILNDVRTRSVRYCEL